MSNRRVTLALIALLSSCGGSKPRTSPPEDRTALPAGTGSAATPAPPDDTRPIALDPSVRRGVLANGMTYYVKANKRPEQRVQLWLAVNAGSLLENDDQRGFAHMVEHLAFEGTKRFPKHDIKDFIERSGMKFGADLNAFTIFDETVYQLAVPSNVIGKGLDVLRDWSSDVAFDAKEVIDERKIIEEERRSRNSVGFRMLQQIIPVQYQGSRYAERLPIGTTQVITAATDDKLRAFYKSWYRPDLMAVIVVGDLDAAAVEKEIQDKFKDVPPSAANAPKRIEAVVETKHAPRMVVARDKENALFSVAVNYQFPHRPEVTAADLRRALVEEMFVQMLSDRFDLISKRAQSSWTGAGARFDSTLRSVDELVLSATVKDGKLKQVVGDLTTELARVRQHGFSADEIQQAGAEIMQAFEEQAKEVDTRESDDLASELLRNFLVREAVPAPAVQLELAKRFIPTVTSAELVALAKSAVEGGRVVVVGAPPKGAVPSEQEVTEQIAAAADKPVGPWQAIDLGAPLLTAEPKPGTVASEQQLAQGVTLWSLSNGARVYLKPTTFKNDEVTITAVSNGGTSVVSAAGYPQALFTAAVVNASGFGNYGVEELKKKLAGKKVAVSVAVDGEHERVAAECSPNDLEPTMQLVYAAFTAPRRDEAAFAAWKAQQTQIANFIAANSQAKFVKEAFDFMFAKHPRIPLPFPTVKAIEAVTLDGALAQYRARVANAADFSFVVVGAFEPAKLKPFVERYLASLPATKARREVIADVGLRIKKGTIAHTVRAGTEAKSMTFLVTWAPTKWSLTLDADAGILRRVLELELMETLREKLGGTYAVSIQGGAERNPPQQLLTFVVFESAPDNAKTMQDETWKALEKIATTPVSDDTLAKVREQLKKAHETGIAENSYWSSTLIRHARYNDELDKLVAIDPVLARVTKEQVQKTARAFVDKTNRATLTLLPEK